MSVGALLAEEESLEKTVPFFVDHFVKPVRKEFTLDESNLSAIHFMALFLFNSSNQHSIEKKTTGRTK